MSNIGKNEAMKMGILREIGNIGLIPVAVIQDTAKATDVARAIIAGGLNTMEITMRTPQAIEAITRVRLECSDMIAGAGTVITLEQARQALDAGAQYIVMPGFDASIVEWCLKNDVAVIPGCTTPSEIMSALRYGIKVIKFFPANIFGGLNAMKALHGPFAGVKFVPTGGIGPDNLAGYSDKPYIHAVGGGWLCNTANIAGERYSAITGAVTESLQTLLGFELIYIGTNVRSVDVKTILEQLTDTFGKGILRCKCSKSADEVKDMITPLGRNEKENLIIQTNNIERAIYHLEKLGCQIKTDGEMDESGNRVAASLEDMVGNYTVRLQQK